MPMPWSRRKPWPYDGQINGTSVLLRPTETGDMVARKVDSLEGVSPTTAEYGSYPPFVERPFVFGRLVGGMGEKNQSSHVSSRYFDAPNCDCSIGGMPRKGPLFVEQHLSGGFVNGFAIGPHGPADQLFALIGTNVWRNEGGTWILSRSGSVEHQQAARFQGTGNGTSTLNGAVAVGATSITLTAVTNLLPSQPIHLQNGEVVTSSAAYVPGTLSVALAAATTSAHVSGATAEWSPEYLCVSTGVGELWCYGGEAWVKATLPTGMLVHWVARLKDELWAFAGNIARRCTGDPTRADAWDGPIRIGDASEAANWIAVLHDQLFFFKENGVYSIGLDGATVRVEELFPELRNPAGDGRGRHAVAWDNRLWFKWGAGLRALTGGDTAVLQSVGPERLAEYDGEAVMGLTAFAGHDDWFGYLVGTAGGTSWLLKYGTWVNPEQDQTAGFERADAWHGYLKKWPGKTVTSAFVSSLPEPALWVGFADASVEYCVLPSRTPDPLTDPNCRFTLEDAWIEAPDHHGMFQADTKNWRAWAAFGPWLNASNYARIEYSVDDGVTWTYLPIDLTSSGQRVEPSADLATNKIRFRVHLVNTATTSTPVIEGAVLYEQVRPSLLLEYDLVVRAGNHLPRLDGATDRRTADQIRTVMRAVVQSSAPVSVTLPDETIGGRVANNYSEVLAPRARRYGTEWDIPLRLVDARTNTVYGLVSRLQPYSVGNLNAFSIAQLNAL